MNFEETHKSSLAMLFACMYVCLLSRLSFQLWGKERLLANKYIKRDEFVPCIS